MKSLLVVVDMQNDFITGSLGTKEAQAILPAAAERIKSWAGDIAVTQDTHYDTYFDTQEGKKLPVMHCLNRSYGHFINTEIQKALRGKGCVRYFEKISFGSPALIEYIKEKEYDRIDFIGLCTDICVVSNALLCKSFFPEAEIVVDSKCCAGTSKENHKAALKTMQACQIEVI